MPEKGRIYKGVGGFYDVKMESGGMVQCKPRGIFRKTGQKPLAGDVVTLGREAGTWFIDEIGPRKNALVRPPVANVDLLFIVASTAAPQPSFLVIDKLAAAAIDQQVQPVVVVTKTDMQTADSLVAVYSGSGIDLVVANAKTGEGLSALRGMLEGRFSVFCGNSGVGKSTLLNALAPASMRETGEISSKLGRGRHTTREVEIFEVGGGLLADTPGFASFDLQKAGAILADNLQLCFPEIKQRIGACRFSGCAHMDEAGCAVRDAVQAGEIAESRYESYRVLHEQARKAEHSY